VRIMNCPPPTAFEEPQVRRAGPALPLVFFADPRRAEGSRYAMSRGQSAVGTVNEAIHTLDFIIHNRCQPRCSMIQCLNRSTLSCSRSLSPIHRLLPACFVLRDCALCAHEVML
jgi:hypothetical protein